MSAEQILFDLALNHIRKQGRPSTRENGGCVYRTEDGRGCAFAPAIEYYDSRMEGGDAYDMLTDWADNIREDVRYVNKDIAMLIQEAHDGSADLVGRENDKEFLSRFESQMAKLAADYDLVYREGEQA